MSWTFDEAVYPDFNAVFRGLLKTLQGLDDGEAAWAKIAASDINEGDARGVIFWNKTQPEIPPPHPTSKWSMESFDEPGAGDTAYNALYEKVRKRLNSLGSRAYYAKIAFTNANHSPASIAVYYPT